MVRAITNLTQRATETAALRPQLAPSDPPLRKTAARVPPGDEVTLSHDALLNCDKASSAAIRPQLVERLRRRIASGQYLTPDKIDVVVQRLHEKLLAR